MGVTSTDLIGLLSMKTTFAVFLLLLATSTLAYGQSSPAFDPDVYLPRLGVTGEIVHDRHRLRRQTISPCDNLCSRVASAIGSCNTA
jgi:hypothetical protein